MLGGKPQALYLVQLLAAFGTNYCFLRRAAMVAYGRAGRAFAVWGSLVLLTFPFALQCHLAVLPCSFQSSLFLLGLFCLLGLFAVPGGNALMQPGTDEREDVTDKEKTRAGGGWAGNKNVSGAGRISLALICFCAMACLYQGIEGSLVFRYGSEAALASRMGWPTLWQDQGGWPEELQEMVRDVTWQAGGSPENMELLCERIKETADPDAAKGYYLQIARHAWQMHSSMIIRQIGWDGLGYALTPIIVPVQLQGEAYDSFTGRNYEVMRGHAPLLTRYYVDYSCWWFLCCLVIGSCLMMLRTARVRMGAERPKAAGRRWKRCLTAMVLCVFLAAVLTVLLTMRGAGLMDYKSTIAVNELWLAGVLLFMQPD